MCVDWLNNAKRIEKLWFSESDLEDVKNLRKKFDSGENFEIELNEIEETIVNCLKFYILSLPSSILGDVEQQKESLEYFNEKIEEEEEKAFFLYNFICKLPDVNQKSIKKLASHFHKHWQDHQDSPHDHPDYICSNIFGEKYLLLPKIVLFYPQICDLN